MKSIPIKDMTKERLIAELTSARNGVDFVMTRVTEVVQANKKLVLQVREYEDQVGAIQNMLALKNKEVMNLENRLSVYNDYNRALHSIMSIPIEE